MTNHRLRGQPSNVIRIPCGFISHTRRRSHCCLLNRKTAALSIICPKHCGVHRKGLDQKPAIPPVSKQQSSKGVVCYAVVCANFQDKNGLVMFESSFRLKTNARAKDTVRPSSNLVKTRKSFGSF